MGKKTSIWGCINKHANTGVIDIRIVVHRLNSLVPVDELFPDYKPNNKLVKMAHKKCNKYNHGQQSLKNPKR